MKTQVGLWIDHRKAVLVRVSDAGEETIEITSNMEKHVRFSGRASESGAGEDVRDRQFGNHLDSYYDKVISCLRNADTIQIFGPGEAKGELKARFEHDGLRRGRILEVSTMDKMTDRQIAARIREHA